MTRPRDCGVIDCMMGIPATADRKDWYASFRPLIRDEESARQFSMPAQYMFKDVPSLEHSDDFVSWLVVQMDAYGVEQALVGLRDERDLEATRRNRDRFFFDAPCDPNGGMEEVRRVKRLHRDCGIKAISVFPAGTYPQVPINHKYMFPLYSAAVEMDIPILLNVGVPGPRIPMETQKVEHLDEICWFFPELKVVMRHGGEPWEALAVKLMLKYPNLYYSTSAFAPKHYPQAILDYANTRGSDKILYAGYFPMGISLERLFRELDDVPLKDEVWPKFLRDNARKLFNLEA